MANTLLKKRIVQLSRGDQRTSTDKNGSCVLYVMSRDQRLQDNHALLSAQLHAKQLGLPVAIGFALYPGSDKRAREYALFMLEGLSQLQSSAQQMNIPMYIEKGSPTEVYRALVKKLSPTAIYFDMSPLRRPRQAQQQVTGEVACPVFVVDTHNVVPVWVASDKQEYAARTLRSKFHTHFNDFLVEPAKILAQKQPDLPAPNSIDSTKTIKELSYKSSGVSHGFTSGETAAITALDDFLENRLRGYSQYRNDPTINGLSNLSPYLHFGQLSSLRVLLSVSELASADKTLEKDAEAIIEEMGVRKELSDNFCYYNQAYDSFAGTPDWAQKTLKKHLSDEREYTYTAAEFENAQTHDDAWNSAQLQLRQQGKIHGYMRMYWAKKVLEWSETPEQALQTLLYLNDFYSIDGGDPNGYVGILWSIAGLHDRPWQERPVYGTVRSMVYNGLKRKFDVQQYIDKYTNK